MIWLLITFFAFSSTETELDTLRIGEDSFEYFEPRSPNKVRKEKVKKNSSTDVGELVADVPGVYVRDEDGYGLRPNIGLRGTNPDRSKKVVLLEDGILIAPAPYAAPAAYYTPSLLRTESLEVFKGFRAGEYGPNSVGGAVNYRSLELPSRLENQIALDISSYSTAQTRISTGNQAKWGGYLLHFSNTLTDGFKTLEDGSSTGFERRDLFAKVRFRLNAKNSLELRLGQGTEDSNETYLGLSDGDFFEDPFQRYAASSLDEMNWTHRKVQLAHSAQLSPSSVLLTQVYHHEFDRTWFRFNGFSDKGLNISNVLRGSDQRSQQYRDILRGQADSEDLGPLAELIYTKNQRSFFSQGVQSEFSHYAENSDWSSDSRVQLRFHRDQILNQPHTSSWKMSEGVLTPGSVSESKVADSTLQANAISLSAANDLKRGRWGLSTFARIEDVTFESFNRLKQSSQSRDDQVFVPGVGVSFQWNDRWQSRWSYNQARTLSGVSIKGEEKSELADNYEFEVRYMSASGQFLWETVFFQNIYQNLTGTCSSSTGCSLDQFGKQFNAGQVRVDGIESRVASGWQVGKIYLPVYLSHTFLDARFTSGFRSENNNEWGFGEVFPGDPLPYIPQSQWQLSLGAKRGKWSQELSFLFRGAVFDQSVSEGRYQIEEFGVVGWKMDYQWNKKLRISAKADNLFDRRYVVAARPFGLRPGKPQSFGLGMQYIF